MKLFGEALEKRASLCYTFRMKYAERLQGNGYYTFPWICVRSFSQSTNLTFDALSGCRTCGLVGIDFQFFGADPSSLLSNLPGVQDVQIVPKVVSE